MQRRLALIPALTAPLMLAACGSAVADPRGVDRQETLLSVSATGEAETRPDQAFFQVGVENFGRTGEAASAANREDIAALLAALKAAGVAEKDIQTRAVNIQRIEWGDRKGQYQASNIVAVTVRDIAKADAAVAAATGAGANVMSGPDLRMTDPEAAANSAYAAAYANARKRAEAYAKAAGMEISRVLYIRDAGGMQGNRYIPGAPPPPPMMPQMAPPEEAAFESGGIIQPGQTTSTVSVQVDFALRAK
ncbi:SIMPL domain-containing protein [Erythrobacter donghaensis]|uniref:SIMPL domain-containing protein n=1 Tax=Erythrobacter donghaensis TaxID=267135 RepID=UPI000A3BF5E0|nr:SIMPL domain-containing protein [Erythrobacter donghaensis]